MTTERDGTTEVAGTVGDVAAARPALLRVTKVSKHFSGVRALDEVTMTVSEGQAVAVIGPNGSGKTTLFNVISGFMRCDGGTIEFEGSRIDGVPAHQIVRRGLARTFQHAVAFAGLTVHENINLARMARSGRKTAAPSRSVEDIAESCGLSRFVDTLAGSLPYGSRRKLGVAIGVATAPRMLLLDEPAAGLGEHEAAELGDVIKGLIPTGVTPVIIDHDMSFVLPLVEHVVVLDAGQNIWEGAPHAVRSADAVRKVYFGE